MPQIEVPAVSQAFAAAGGATGIIQVASSVGFYAGCIAYVTGTALPGLRVIIVAIIDSTHIKARIIGDDNEGQVPIQVYGGGSNFSAYTNLNGGLIAMESQLARVDINTTAPTSLNK